jgi:hypothetical protein
LEDKLQTEKEENHTMKTTLSFLLIVLVLASFATEAGANCGTDTNYGTYTLNHEANCN